MVVTGGSGFLGQHIVKMLHEKSEVSEIRVFDKTSYSKTLGKPLVLSIVLIANCHCDHCTSLKLQRNQWHLDYFTRSTILVLLL